MTRDEYACVKSMTNHNKKYVVGSCCNLPFGGGTKRPRSWAKAFVSEGENERSHHQRLFEENVRKTKKMMVCGFWKWGFESCLSMRKVRPSQGTTTSNRVCKTWLQNYVFSLLCFFYVFSLFIFLIFLGSTRVLPLLLLIIGYDEKIRPT